MARSMAARFASGQAAYKKQHPFTPFTPYSPPPIPSGAYDPALDAQAGAAQRGLGDTQFDYTVNQARAGVDYGLQQDAINLNQSRGLQDYATSYGRNSQDLSTSYGRNSQDLSTSYGRNSQDLSTQYGYGMQDYGTQLDRGMADYQTSFDRGSQDYSRNVGLLQRSYSQLQNRQAQSISAAGLQGGAALQAAAKRTANQAIDQQPLDTAWQRQQQDIGTGRSRLSEDVSTGQSRLTSGYNTNTSRLGEDYRTNTGRLGEDYRTNTGRLGEDYATNTGRLTQDTSNQLGALGIQYQRGQDDAATQLSRAQREGAQFGVDTEAEKAFAAAQGDYMAPGRGQAGGIPQNEHVTASGQHFQTFDRGGVRYYVDPSGKVLKTKKLK